MGENNELKNRYLLVNPPEEWKQTTHKYSTSTAQAQDKYGTSTGQVTGQATERVILLAGVGRSWQESMRGNLARYNGVYSIERDL